MATTKAARYAVALASTGEILLPAATEKQAVKLGMQYSSPLTYTRNDGAACERRGRGIVPVGYVAPARSEALLEAAAIGIAAGALSHRARPVRETREQRADWLEDVEGDADAAERARTGRID